MYNITFKNSEHENFYLETMKGVRYPDCYNKSLIYLLGISRITREHFGQIFNVKSGYIKVECLCQGWVNRCSEKIIRLAFNLYTGWTPTISDCHNEQERLEECSPYTVNEIFCCDYARYLWQGIKLRYPEYTTAGRNA